VLIYHTLSLTAGLLNPYMDSDGILGFCVGGVHPRRPAPPWWPPPVLPVLTERTYPWGIASPDESEGL